MNQAAKIIRHAKALDAALENQSAIEHGLYPVVLYFGSAEDRDGFIAVVREAVPGLSAHKLDADPRPTLGVPGGRDVTEEYGPAMEQLEREMAANIKPPMHIRLRPI